MIDFIKAHAYGNDFLYVLRHDVRELDVVSLARTMCERRTGVGADGLIVYDLTERGASMRLRNADGSRAEVSGNGVRGLAAIVASRHLTQAGTREDGSATDQSPAADPRLRPNAKVIVVETDSGEKRLTLEAIEDGRYTFRAAMGQPEGIGQRTLDVAGERLVVTTLRVGNPQCVVLGVLEDARFRRLGPALARHPAFPEGTNVEFAQVEAPDRIRILIWERGVGPTQASGTGACAAAVTAAAYGGAARDVHVVSPGGSQRVEWLAEGLFLTGWAQVTVVGRWLPE
jgi:diaminopimelate epimerase